MIQVIRGAIKISEVHQDEGGGCFSFHIQMLYHDSVSLVLISMGMQVQMMNNSIFAPEFVFMHERMEISIVNTMSIALASFRISRIWAT